MFNKPQIRMWAYMLCGLLWVSCKNTSHSTQMGGLGEPCYQNLTCGHGLRCNSASTCETCAPGTQGCACAANNTCTGSLSCSSGLCQYRSIAPHISCYTPCEQSYTESNGTLHTCSADGFIEGCVGNTSCVQGYCQKNLAVPTINTCSTDLDCAEHQACVENKCGSTCNTQSDCSSTETCYKHVCRLACSTENNTSPCPQNTHCISEDGSTGACLPLAVKTQTSALQTGAYSLSSNTFILTSAVRQQTLQITNFSNASKTFTLTKKSALHYDKASQRGFTNTSNPLSKLSMRESSAQTSSHPLVVTVPSQGSVNILFSIESEDPSIQQGVVAIAESGSVSQDLTFYFEPGEEGRWTGQKVSFAYFPTEGLEEWLIDKNNLSKQNNVRNALFQKWQLVKQTNGLDGLKEWYAILAATQQESWKSPSLKRYCPNPTQACYLYDNDFGFGVYSSDTTAYPIPTGASALPVALNIRYTSISRPFKMEGMLDSSVALHQSGNPAIEMTSGMHIPGACSQNNIPCLNVLQSFNIRSAVGPRYASENPNTTCSEAWRFGENPSVFKKTATPWLLPGFTQNTYTENNQRYTTQCVGYQNPWGDNETKHISNMYAASANPESTGFPIYRNLTLIDGAFIANETLFILYKETFYNTRIPERHYFTSYGYFLLNKEHIDTSNNALFAGNTPVQTEAPHLSVKQKGCSSNMLQKVLGKTSVQNNQDASHLVTVLMNGNTYANTVNKLPPYGEADGYSVHAYCEDTGTLDQGPLPTTDPVSCPIESRVIYFASRNLTRNMVSQLDCQQSILRNGLIPKDPVTQKNLLKGTCGETLAYWFRTHSMDTRTDIGRQCKDPSLFYCDTQRQDLFADQEFFFNQSGQGYFDPIHTSIKDAFRYKFRFTNRNGTSLGFTPSLCTQDTEKFPYCYDAPAIEELEERIACLQESYIEHNLRISTELKNALHSFLRFNFGFNESTPGFEYLHAELLIMLGDEAMTQSYTSRFDMAQSSLGVFRGELFEEEGVSLSGTLGSEMIHLYQAVQYYQKVLKRFERNRHSIENGVYFTASNRSFVGENTASTYLLKLVRASTQKARAFSEIARRYHAINKASLARKVIERAYEGIYLESITLNNFFIQVHNTEKPLSQNAVLDALQKAQKSYASALLDMYETYQALSNDTTVAGFTPDYMPFPALNPADTNAFDKIIASAEEKTNIAQRKEEQAIAYSRNYNTHMASFENELHSIQNTYENELSNLCGTLTASNGQIYPAIPEYAYLNNKALSLGNPCGLMGTGELTQARGQVDTALVQLKATQARGDALVAQMQHETERVSQMCAFYASLADYEYTQQNKIYSAQNSITRWNQLKERVSHTQSFADSVANNLQCLVSVTGTDCGGALAAAGVKTIAFAVARTEIDALNNEIRQKQQDAALIETSLARWKTRSQCDLASIDSNARMKSMLIELHLNSIETVRSEYAVRLALGQVQSISNKAQALTVQYQESVQLAKNIQASQNNPNVRIYKNDAIIAADRTFNEALREAYRATLVYEYYTSQSYAKKGDLFLTRMVSYGDHSLEEYLSELKESFYTFEEYFGKPDLRLAIVSMRDDILNIPRIGPTGEPLSLQQRVDLLRKKLQETTYYTPEGFLSLPFSTQFKSVSPLTRNHKIVSLEAEVIGSDIGDNLGRIYVVQSGTSSVSNFNGSRNYYLFTPKPAVVNTFFNGSKPLSPSLYKNDRLRDRPYINTEWRMVLNQQNESVNQDINLQSLTDIRLYVYYSDFTEL
jgi:hypothetical protein